MDSLKKILIPKTKGHFIIELIIVFLIVTTFGLNTYRVMSGYSYHEYNSEIRDIEEIKAILLENSNVKIFATSLGAPLFDLYGNCYLDLNLGKMEYCNYKILNLNALTIQIVYVDEEEIQAINVSYNFGYNIYYVHPTNCIEDFCLYVSRGSVSYNSIKGIYESQGGVPDTVIGLEKCGFRPFDSAKTKCWPSDIAKAKSIFESYNGLLNEMGVSENEIIELTRWFEEEINMKLSSMEY